MVLDNRFRAFIDTNVLVDVLTRRDPFYADAQSVLSLCEQGMVRGQVSVLSLTTVDYLVRKLAGETQAREAVQAILALFEIVPADGRMAEAAFASGMRDFEDAFQYECARTAGAQCVITRNKKDFPAGAIPVVTPTEFHTFRSHA